MKKENDLNDVIFSNDIIISNSLDVISCDGDKIGIAQGGVKNGNIIFSEIRIYDRKTLDMINSGTCSCSVGYCKDE